MTREEMILVALSRRTITYELIGWAKTCSLDVLEKLIEETPVVCSDDPEDTRRAIVTMRATGASKKVCAELAERVVATSLTATVDDNARDVVLARHAKAMAAQRDPQGDRELAEIAKTAGISVEALLQRRRKLDAETCDDED